MTRTTRRAVLAATSSGLAVGLAGCQSNDSETTPVDTEDGPAPEPLPPDPFYVENFTADELAFGMSITRQSDDSELISGRFRVGAEQGVRFPTVGVNGDTYYIEVAFEGHDPATYEWNVTECPEEYRNEEGQAASAYLRDGEVGFDQNQCDAIAVGNALTYLSYEEAALESDA